MNHPLPRDLAPGEDHIQLRTPTRTYYAVFLFDENPVAKLNVYAPLFIRDIVHSADIIGIYGFLGLHSQARANYVMVNNHPLLRVRVSGRIVGETIRETEKQECFIYVLLDDSSCLLYLTCKITKRLWLPAGLPFDNWKTSRGTMIELEGSVATFNRRIEFQPVSVKVIGGRTDLDVEMRLIREKHAFRQRYLVKPWVYEPPQTTAVSNHPVVPLMQKDCVGKQARRDLIESTETVQGSPEDSLYVHHRNIKRRNPDIIKASELLANLEDEVMVALFPRTSFVFEQIPLVAPVTEVKLKLAVIKWIIRKHSYKFPLKQLYHDRSVAAKLRNFTIWQMQNNRLHPPETTVTFDRLLARIFHDIRHEFQVGGLLKCSSSYNCYAGPMIEYVDQLKMTLLLISSGELCERKLDCVEYTRAYRSLREKQEVDMAPEVVYGVIGWLLGDLALEYAYLLTWDFWRPYGRRAWIFQPEETLDVSL
ncbi:hypothetical protein BABINDRAFT_159362 [Babjeviella inositovora NRRL Y-12698]|uniref:CST complex subunit Stn1 N-terminal domain-containing protein n=1 Tax=Babjeviella inositovora NRRL Y-12698 TaxID=984486 RepID=A0A1E3QZ22_9ASCO|nr:uncharacterized protein BABINDRAFT_159362 [Babjeviella inositovora NRRL Y-12698]ODQ82865.1 hypothetical protein BABINDRAFT_159362 [Babjeviella inositovora NRRL Y-12698]